MLKNYILKITNNFSNYLVFIFWNIDCVFSALF